MKKPTRAPLAGNAATAPFPTPGLLEVTRMRYRGWTDRRRYRDRVPVGEHTHFTLQLAGIAHEWMRVVDLWEAQQCGSLTLELATQRSIIAEAPAPESPPPAAASTGDSARDRVAAARREEAARAARSRSAATEAARQAAVRRHDELLADIEAVHELAWDARRRIEERYRQLVSAYSRSRYRHRDDTGSAAGMRLPGLGDLPRYDGIELADRPGGGSHRPPLESKDEEDS